ncbi:Alpha/Beta hydrolase protein [Cantharellus anzutake]|uniref:Alpha/Beta hydrolase protein n=1 Tax=Cantharellus anzutake TaxID=1750568 RepID=UPI00190775F3|nr:Alpha/Beta hydrolase protein [Cantharellus anzutake]KAF8339212.1 Alpha/Beta hydrolase protein [Cantharellus anzutake]
MATALIGAKVCGNVTRQSIRSISRAIAAKARVEAPQAKPSPKFPCVVAHAERESRLQAGLRPAPAFLSPSPTPANPSASGPEPPYARPNPTSYRIYHHSEPFPLIYSRTPFPEFDIAYETWGELSPAKDNAILLHTGLSASSHAASTSLNPASGWWEKFVGQGKALDTDQFFVICTNVLGGCYGSTGPSSINPHSAEDGAPYGTNFPVLSIFDIARAQFHLLDHFGIKKLYASVGSSMGGMTSLATAWLHPDRVGKIVSISGTARSSPSAIAMRFAQRSVLMADPNWKNGFYYDDLPPHTGMKLARQIATITYRSGPEWEQRFGRKLRELPPDQHHEPGHPRTPALCSDFLIETYLDHQGEQFCLKYDANSLIYISKAMDLFDMTLPAIQSLGLSPPATPSSSSPGLPPLRSLHTSTPPPHLSDLSEGLSPLSKTPTLILGVQSDILFPVEQQRELADALRMAGNDRVVYYELGGVWGHDTFLIDVANVGGAIRGFLSLNS